MAVSQYDKEHLTSDQQAQIQAVTDAAQAGSMDWSTAHSIAEGIRAQAAGGGYSGGDWGNEYNPIASSGNKADPYAGTNYAQDMIDYAREYAKQASSGGTGDWGAVLDAMAQREQKVSAIGTDYGKSSNDLLQELYDLYYAPYQKPELEMPSYGGSQWDSVLNQAAQELISMNYEDWTQGDQYKALADRYGIQGQMSMQDVLGQISSRTGGLASSYATTAAQQQYNDYMAQLEEVARQMYAGDRSDLLDNAQLAQGLADRDYNRYLDSLDQYYAERDYQYQVGRDQVSDSRYDQQYADSTAATNKDDAMSRINAYLAAYGSVADLDADLIAQSGYTPAELAALEQYYAQEQAAANAPKSSGGGGGGGGTTTGELDYEGLFAAAQASGNPRSWLAQKANYQKYGFTSSSGLYNDYEAWQEGQEPEDGGKNGDVKPSSANGGFGTSYSSIWSRARTMFDQGKSTEEIMAYLDRFDEKQLTDAGLEYIMNSLNLGGYRTGG